MRTHAVQQTATSFRETGFRGQRKMRSNDLPTVTKPSLRTNRRTDARQFEAFRTPSGNLTVAHDCVVVDAAWIEPVSTLNSLLAGNLAGNFLEKGFRKRFSSLKRVQHQLLIIKFPAQKSREFS
jgi:hypothetical protein